jgi:NAD-dependent deacetylase
VAGEVATAAATRLAELIREAGTVVALTGAGISVPSGIPDFRSPGSGLWANVNPMEVAHIDAFRADPVRFWQFYGQRFQTLDGKRPNGAHAALAELERLGALEAVVTQNIDGLHLAAGSEDVVEVHGSITHAVCLRCDAREEQREVRARMAASDDGVPRCVCGDPLKPDVVLFGEFLSEPALARASALAEAADVLLCVGTSLEVYPIAQLPQITLAAGGAVALVTKGPTPYDPEAQVKLDGDVVTELEAVLAALA